MFKKIRSSLVSLVIIAVLVLSAFSPTIAYADGGTTTDATPTQTTGSECNPNAKASAPDGCATGKETSPPDEDKDSKESAPAGDAAPVADLHVLEKLPANTTITVLNADGQMQSLATQEAVEAVSQSDPIWCPEGAPPTPGANGCTQSFTSFSALLEFMSGNAAYQGAGTIYVQQGAYTGGESSIDFNSSAYDLSNIHDFDLSIVGGWNTSTNVVDVATTSNFDIPIIIGMEGNPWGGTLTVSNIAISGTTGNGLTIYAQNDINLTNVSVSYAEATSGNENGSGAELDAGGNVTIDNSNFIGNRTSGATIRSGGEVAISNSNFSNPPLSQNLHGRQQIAGLNITSDGSVSLFNVVANGNRRVGANIVSGGRVTIVQSVFSGTMSINGGNQFYGYGLQVVTPDIIDLDTVTANDNFLWGASLDAGGDVNIANSIFNANTTDSPGFIDDTGLLVTSGGNVSIQNTQANDNRLIGATIEAAGDVSINSSSFSNNNGVTIVNGTPEYHGYGLNVVTPGNIFINMVTASNNTLFGAHLEGGGDVIVSSSDFSNQASDSPEPLGRGLEVISGGNIFLDNVTLNNNETFGADLQAAQDVYMESVTATGNGTDGVALQAICTHLIGGTFTGNGAYGLNLGTSSLDMVIMPAFGGNVLGDIFPQTPVSCAAPVPPAPPVANPVTGGARVTGGTASSVLDEAAGNVEKSASAGSGYASVTLNTYLANTRTGTSSSHGIFIGKYAYVHTLSGLQIFAIVPDEEFLAMSGS